MIVILYQDKFSVTNSIITKVLTLTQKLHNWTHLSLACYLFWSRWTLAVSGVRDFGPAGPSIFYPKLLTVVNWIGFAILQLNKDSKSKHYGRSEEILSLRYNWVGLVPGLPLWPKEDTQLNHILPWHIGPNLKLNKNHVGRNATIAGSLGMYRKKKLTLLFSSPLWEGWERHKKCVRS